jgi:hypothetical protein
MFYCLFPHLITSDIELVLGHVNVFKGMQNLCSFVLVNLQGDFGLFCSPCTKFPWNNYNFNLLIKTVPKCNMANKDAYV